MGEYRYLFQEKMTTLQRGLMRERGGGEREGERLFSNNTVSCPESGRCASFMAHYLKLMFMRLYV